VQCVTPGAVPRAQDVGLVSLRHHHDALGCAKAAVPLSADY
jgi:hypothetical protein